MEEKVIALDAMGGDNAPRMVVQGAFRVLCKRKDVRFILCGDEGKIKPLLAVCDEPYKDRFEIIHTTSQISPEDRPSFAIRHGGDSSMYRAIHCVLQGKASGVVSAGNTGAFMVLSRYILGLITGVDRPAIVSRIPILADPGFITMLDLGANVDCNGKELFNFAVMGSAFASTFKHNPSVALLNIGSEKMKGNKAIRDAVVLFRSCKMNFQGYIEAHELVQGKVDVIVCDGFTGNVAIKSMEGVMSALKTELRKQYDLSLSMKLGAFFARSEINRFKSLLDKRKYDGGMLVGLNDVAIKSHGSGDEVAFSNSIMLALDAVSKNIISKINTNIANEIYDAQISN